MNSSALLVLILGGIIVLILIAAFSGEFLGRVFSPILVVLSLIALIGGCIIGGRMLYTGIVLTIQGVQMNNVSDTFFSFFIAFIGAVLCLGCFFVLVSLVRNIVK